MKHPGRLLLSFLLAFFAVATTAAAAAGCAPKPGKTTMREDGARVLWDMTCATVDGMELQLDLYLPPENATGATGKETLPLVMWIHGGGYYEGKRGFSPFSPLTEDGCAVASITCRLMQKAIFPAQIHDAKAALRWLRANADHFNIDPGRIAVIGESAGAHLGNLIGTSAGVPELEGDGGVTGVSTRVSAVISLCGPGDIMFAAEDPDLARVPALLAGGDPRQVRLGKTILSRNAIMSKMAGGPLAEHKGMLRLMNPMEYVSADDPPFLFFHGDADDLIPISQSEVLRDALRAKGVEAELIVIPGAGHGIGSFDRAKLLTQSREFLDKHLKRAAGAAATKP
jgi:acetyl esterase/lipase